jgi:hypothetical protein
MFQSAAELKRRDLVQQRGIWRAVLPQAIANRLATEALQNIPFSLIERELVNGAPERLLRSFSRRLGYLHTCKKAVAVVHRWLSDGGLLSKVLELDELSRTVFRNVAPVSPDAALAALERNFESRRADPATIEGPDFFLHLLRSLAYEATLFERCAALISQVVQRSSKDQRAKAAEDGFSSLFTIYLSGTLASIEQRVGVTHLLNSNESRAWACRSRRGVTDTSIQLNA